jgi:hypothetical protein
MENRDIYLGASDWMAPAWQGKLYPEGLPDDWRLAYFNTQFDCVWLSHSSWSLLAPEVALSWLEDTGDGFRFVLESGDVTSGSDFQAALAPKLAGYWEEGHPGLLWFHAGTDLREFSGLLTSTVHRPIYLLSRDGDMATIERIRTLLGLLGLGGGTGVG